ncbi:hypothetical protein DFS34DRAFT_663569 [Phlyctochytrium arcticum]|nr:hypothetical protein DFS34DRAFT_663569 [Phlyctochytrium arcticum]
MDPEIWIKKVGAYAMFPGPSKLECGKTLPKIGRNGEYISHIGFLPMSRWVSLTDWRKNIGKVQTGGSPPRIPRILQTFLVEHGLSLNLTGSFSTRMMELPKSYLPSLFDMSVCFCVDDDDEVCVQAAIAVERTLAGRVPVPIHPKNEDSASSDHTSSSWTTSVDDSSSHSSLSVLESEAIRTYKLGKLSDNECILLTDEDGNTSDDVDIIGSEDEAQLISTGSCFKNQKDSRTVDFSDVEVISVNSACQRKDKFADSLAADSVVDPKGKGPDTGLTDACSPADLDRENERRPALVDERNRVERDEYDVLASELKQCFDRWNSLKNRQEYHDWSAEMRRRTQRLWNLDIVNNDQRILGHLNEVTRCLDLTSGSFVDSPEDHLHGADHGRDVSPPTVTASTVTKRKVSEIEELGSAERPAKRLSNGLPAAAMGFASGLGTAAAMFAASVYYFG